MGDKPEKIYVPEELINLYHLDKPKNNKYLNDTEYIHVDKAYSYDEGYGKGYNFGKEAATKNIKAVWEKAVKWKKKHNGCADSAETVETLLLFKEMLKAIKADLNES